ncbi:MAG: cobyrinate a,c-diamide synthase [Pseudomonadota bacterium]
MRKGFLIAAPASGSGKTVLTLAILRALHKRGVMVQPAKAGPDFIDPAFHTAASGETCFNLDPWAMGRDRLLDLADNDGLLVVEGMMGLFDGAADGSGSAADLAETLGLPIVLVVDCAKQSHSIAALVSGFVNHCPQLRFGGVILNRVGSARHEALLRDALAPMELPILGCVFRDEKLATPSRHLGLVQAQERDGLEAFLDHAAAVAEAQIDLDGLAELKASGTERSTYSSAGLPVLGQRIAVARDAAFSFIYPHWLRDWHNSGCELSFFSPLADEAPASDSEAVFLPGGYPELHGGQISEAHRFKSGLSLLAEAGVAIYGECGGFMVLGQGLLDADGENHAMAGLLPHATSFAKRKLHLGYRNAMLQTSGVLGEVGSLFAAHEFHYSSLLEHDAAGCSALFDCVDARGKALGLLGLQRGRVAGSYLHLIDRRPS